MQAVILAGGKGTRLRSVIGNILPKPLIPLAETTLLDYLIMHLKKNGYENVIICTGYHGEQISEYISKQQYDLSIMLSQEDKPLGTAGALQLISDYLEDEFFVLYGDVFTTIDLQQMYRFHTQKKADVTLAIHTSDHPFDSTIVSTDKNFQITHFVEKPGKDWGEYGNLTTTPLYIMRKNVLDFIPRDESVDFAKNVFPAMQNKGKKLFGYLTKEYAKDIGTPERYRKVLQILNT